MVKLKCLAYFFVIIQLLGINYSCNKDKFPFDKEGLTYKNQFFFSNQIRLDGYYYSLDSISRIEYFYIDGIWSYGAEGELINSDTCHQINESIRYIPYFWGYYIIHNDTIKIQTYDPGSRNKYSEYKVEERWGLIKNDTTLYFFKKLSPGGGERALDELYQFKHCLNKPDSTNLLME